MGDLKIIHNSKSKNDPVQQYCDCYDNESYWPWFTWHEDEVDGKKCTYVVCSRCHEPYLAGVLPKDDL